MKLSELCKQFDNPIRLRIRLNGQEFSYGSEEYHMHQNDEIVDHKVKEDRRALTTVLHAFYEEQPEEKPPEPPPYIPEQPLYPGIGI